eukprot:scaffold50201_cov55-Phaeocystis_antarctica.AAC.3
MHLHCGRCRDPAAPERRPVTVRRTENRAAKDTIKSETQAPATTNRRHHTRRLARAAPYGPPNTQSHKCTTHVLDIRLERTKTYHLATLWQP